MAVKTRRPLTHVTGTVDGAGRAGRVRAVRAGGGRAAVPGRDEGVRGTRARRTPDGVRPGPGPVVPGAAGTGPVVDGAPPAEPDDARPAEPGVSGVRPSGRGRAGGTRGRVQVPFVLVPDVGGFARLVLGVGLGPSERYGRRRGKGNAGKFNRSFERVRF